MDLTMKDDAIIALHKMLKTGPKSHCLRFHAGDDGPDDANQSIFTIDFARKRSAREWACPHGAMYQYRIG